MTKKKSINKLFFIDTTNIFVSMVKNHVKKIKSSRVQLTILHVVSLKGHG